MENTIKKVIAQVSSDLCKARVELEAVSNGLYELWKDYNGEQETEQYLLDLSQRIQDCANAVAEIENETFNEE